MRSTSWKPWHSSRGFPTDSLAGLRNMLAVTDATTVAGTDWFFVPVEGWVSRDRAVAYQRALQQLPETVEAAS